MKIFKSASKRRNNIIKKDHKIFKIKTIKTTPNDKYEYIDLDNNKLLIKFKDDKNYKNKNFKYSIKHKNYYFNLNIEEQLTMKKNFYDSIEICSEVTDSINEIKIIFKNNNKKLEKILNNIINQFLFQDRKDSKLVKLFYDLDGRKLKDLNKINKQKLLLNIFPNKLNQRIKRKETIFKNKKTNLIDPDSFFENKIVTFDDKFYVQLINFNEKLKEIIKEYKDQYINNLNKVMNEKITKISNKMIYNKKDEKLGKYINNYKSHKIDLINQIKNSEYINRINFNLKDNRRDLNKNFRTLMTNINSKLSNL